MARIQVFGDLAINPTRILAVSLHKGQESCIAVATATNGEMVLPCSEESAKALLLYFSDTARCDADRGPIPVPPAW